MNLHPFLSKPRKEHFREGQAEYSIVMDASRSFPWNVEFTVIGTNTLLQPHKCDLLVSELGDTPPCILHCLSWCYNIRPDTKLPFSGRFLCAFPRMTELVPSASAMTAEQCNTKGSRMEAGTPNQRAVEWPIWPVSESHRAE